VRYTDVFVETSNPEMLDQTIASLGAALIQDGEGNYELEDGYYVARVFGDSGFLKFALETQGYARVHGERVYDD
jgi:hypothetical protein